MTKAFLKSGCNISATFPLFTGAVILSKKRVGLDSCDLFLKNLLLIYLHFILLVLIKLWIIHAESFWVPKRVWLVCLLSIHILLPFLLLFALHPAGISSSTLIAHSKIIANVSRSASAGPSLTVGWLSSVPPSLSNFSNLCLTFKTFNWSKHFNTEEITGKYQIMVIMHWFISLLTQEN